MTNEKRKKKLFRYSSFRTVFNSILLAAVALSAAPTVHAADLFNVGDRVEVDDLGNGNWRAGLVTAENDRTYLVRMDPLNPGGSTVDFTVPKTGVYENRIRASNANLPEAQKINSLEPIGILDCPTTEGVSRTELDNAVLARLIRCLSEYKNGKGASPLGNESRFDITAMTVGRPRVWNVLNDVGPGTAATPVYPVQVSYTQIWWSRDSIRTMKGVAIYGCYYSTLSQWVCGLDNSIKNEPILTQPRR